MKLIKKILKKALPASMAHQLNVAYVNRGAFMSDKRRFLRNYSKGKGRVGQQHLKAMIIYHSHSIEKGLSHTDLRFGFGRKVLAMLASTMNQYRHLGFDVEDKAYSNALSVLKKYIDVHEANGRYIGDILAPFDSILKDFKEDVRDIGGTVQITKESKQDNATINFEQLFNNRYSVREFDSSPVETYLIDMSIELAAKSPSVCNRQACRVIILTDEELIREAVSIQGGLNGYEIPPALLVVVSDIRNYIGINERNQPYIDGGLFAMSLLLALEYSALAACSLNAMFNVMQAERMRALLGVSDYESFIMLIAVGNFREAVKAPKSFRYSAVDIARTREL